MKAIDMTPIIKKYPGYFVALSRDRKEVLGKGCTPEEVLEEANKKGHKEPILTKIPNENRSYLLFLIGLMFVCMTTQTIFAQPWYKENFDELDKGELTGQDGWMGEVANDSSEVEDGVARGGKGKSLYIVENSGNQREFAEVHEGVQYFSFYTYRENEGGGDLQIYTGSSSNWAGAMNVAIFSRISKDGTLRLANGNGDGSVKEELATLPYPIKEWFHVRLVMDFDDQNYAGYLNGQLAAENVRFRGAPIGLGWINIRWDHDAKLSIYVDDMELGDGEGGEEAVNPNAQMTSVVWGKLKGSGE